MRLVYARLTFEERMLVEDTHWTCGEEDVGGPVWPMLERRARVKAELGR